MWFVNIFFHSMSYHFMFLMVCLKLKTLSVSYQLKFSLSFKIIFKLNTFLDSLFSALKLILSVHFFFLHGYSSWIISSIVFIKHYLQEVSVLYIWIFKITDCVFRLYMLHVIFASSKSPQTHFVHLLNKQGSVELWQVVYVQCKRKWVWGACLKWLSHNWTFKETALSQGRNVNMRHSYLDTLNKGFPGGANGKEPPANSGDMRQGFDPWIGKTPWRRA